MIQCSPPIAKALPLAEKVQTNQSIKDLLSIGAIEECDPSDGQFISPTFLVPKPNGRTRFILNLKSLNKFISTAHFKLEDLRTAINLINKGCFMSTVDLKDAYFLIPIHSDHKKYLRFEFNGKLFQFNVLPFGLNTAPFVFTKLMKPVISLLRSCGFLSTIYLDDILLISNTYESCVREVSYTVSLLQSLGFIINKEKSALHPNTNCKFLGFIIDTEKLQISLPNEKIHKIKKEIDKFKILTRCKVREFARLVGLLTSACPAVEYGWLYTKELERCKYLNIKEDNNYDKYMTIPPSILPDLAWWSRVISNSVNKIKQNEYCLVIYSDASTTGWGAACEEKRASGMWSDSERSRHINYLEILAAFFGLKIFAKSCYNCQILLRIDNTTAISYINRMGGIQFPHLTEVTKQIWQWCERRKIILSASYISSADNNIADAESRRVHPDIEWELSDHAFNRITKHFGIPEIDIFASRLNTKCKKYISWHRDPDAYVVDAFTISWKKFFFYGFPPFSIILKTLRKIENDHAEGIIVVPHWPTQPWFPLFNKLLVSDTLIFKPNKNLINSHSSNRDVHQKTTLVAGILSGNRS